MIESTTVTDRIAASLRQQIVRGEIPPGGRLPSWNALEESFDVTRATLSRVFTRLRDDGFVYSSSKRGTYVVDRPPHLFRHALAFPESPGGPGWNRFWKVLADEAQSFEDEAGNYFACFYDVHTNLENASHNRLLREVVSDRFASLTVVGHPEMVSPWIWKRANLPKLGVWESRPQWAGPSIYVDRKTFIARSLDYLQQRGRKRVAVLTVPTETLDGFEQAAAKRGLFHPRRWRLSTAADHASTVRPIVELLMSLPPEERPDGLVIADDNLVEDAVAALLSVDCNIHKQLDVVADCTWPKPVRTPFPIKYLGYDVRRILVASIEGAAPVGSKPRCKEAGRAHLGIPALFEDEQMARRKVI